MTMELPNRSPNQSAIRGMNTELTLESATSLLAASLIHAMFHHQLKWQHGINTKG